MKGLYREYKKKIANMQYRPTNCVRKELTEATLSYMSGPLLFVPKVTEPLMVS